VFLIIEVPNMSVMGFLQRDEVIGEYVEDMIERGGLIGASIFSFAGGENTMPKDLRKPDIAISNSFLSRWYIKDVGSIPRWSKYSKLLDKRRNELLLK
jgi:hypothetical protein